VGLSESLNLLGFWGTVGAVREYDCFVGFCDQTFGGASVMMMSVDKVHPDRTANDED
jgi:hypothetical protein